MNEIEKYLKKRTLIIGEVNSGKTLETCRILQLFIDAGYTEDITVLDMSPGAVNGIGGKMQFPEINSELYLTADIHAPRLAGKDKSHTSMLSKENVNMIEKLFGEVKKHEKDILFVNDASLYLQAGELEYFEDMLMTTSTQVINSYYGDHFKDSSLTRREKRLAEELMKTCDHVVRM